LAPFANRRGGLLRRAQVRAFAALAGAQVVHYDLRAFTGRELGDLRADSAACARHNDHLSCE
jgi:hypothetical protein